MKNFISLCSLFVMFSIRQIECIGQSVFISPVNKSIQTQGRVAIFPSGPAEIYWPGSGFKLIFRGRSLKAEMSDERGYNYFNVIIDGKFSHYISVSIEKKKYTLFDALKDTTHTVEILKRADWFRGKSWLYGFELDAGAVLLNQKSPKRSIEFYGNSVTVGAAVEDEKRDSGDSTFTNNYRSYAAITARHFNANYSCIASSGIGLMVSWGSLIMPDIYDRLNPDDSLSKWDFSKHHPNIVVVNLFQNDCSILAQPDHVQFKRRFGNVAPTETQIINAYVQFIRSLRKHYPRTYIICSLGSMSAVEPGSPWPGYIKKAAALVADKKIYCYFFDPIYSNKHPKINQQQNMADSLIHFIEKNIKW